MKIRQAILLAMIALLAPRVLAQDPPPQTISAMCRTPSATGDGGTFQCASESSQLVAPEGFAFARETLDGGIDDSGGPKPACEVEWTEMVALAPGSDIQQPRVLTLRARANSQRGYARRGPGWATCSYTVQLVPYVAP